MGGRFVYVRHDRRIRSKAVADEKRGFEKTAKNMIALPQGLYFEKATKLLYRRTGDRLVLFARDRRKGSRAVTNERRKGR
jgi:hypothetical protein